MKIPSITHCIRKAMFPICTAVMMLPAKRVEAPAFRLANYEQCSTLVTEIRNSSNITAYTLKGLNKIKTENFRGGILYKYDDESVKILKARIMRRPENISYNAPIDNAKNVYLEKFGMYFADRPNGKLTRPHLGLDIFVSQFAKKPKSPVLIKAPLDGVVIASKRARKKDNVIGNYIAMLGVDGRRYGFDHMARPTDYHDSIPLPEVGTILKAGDKIGYVGHTGETNLWHLHFTVMTDEMQKKQLKDPYWINMSKKTGYCPLNGNVDPLNKEKAGEIATILNKYKH